MATNFDLLGDPIPDGWGKRGRPPHMPTDEKRSLVIQLLAFGWEQSDIAAALDITAKTLRKNYSRQLKVRDNARLRVRARLLAQLMTEAESGNVGAIKEYFAHLDKASQRELADAVAHRGKPRMEPKLGKKELQSQRAGEITGKFAPPPEPSLIN